jgi:5'-deoxynucleotidase YfbR-like HD superfamily hydrolase
VAVTYGYPTEEDKTKWSEIEAREKKTADIRAKKDAVSALELKNLRKLYDGEDITAVNAERAKLRKEINALTTG